MKHRKIAGCIPIKHLEDSKRTSVLLISSRKHHGQLVFPKGGVKNNETAKEAALRESFEEAGLRGDIIGLLFSKDDKELICYSDILGLPWDDKVCEELMEKKETCLWFILDVKCEVTEYPEKGERRKYWMRIEDAKEVKSISDSTKNLLEKVEAFLHDCAKK